MESPSKVKPAPVKSPAIQADPFDPAIVLTYGDLNQISEILAKRITSREELFDAIRSLTHLSVEGVAVRLEPRLLMRLQTRCLDKPHWTLWLSEVVKKQLHDYAGW